MFVPAFSKKCKRNMLPGIVFFNILLKLCYYMFSEVKFVTSLNEKIEFNNISPKTISLVSGSPSVLKTSGSKYQQNDRNLELSTIKHEPTLLKLLQ